MMRVRESLLAFLIGVFIVGVGGSVLFTVAFGDVSTDAGSRWMTLVYAFVMTSTLALVGGAGFGAVVLPLQVVIRGASKRVAQVFGISLGATAAICMGIGLTQSLARSLLPGSGRVAWLASCALTGAAAGLVFAAFAATAKILGVQRR